MNRFALPALASVGAACSAVLGHCTASCESRRGDGHAAIPPADRALEPSVPEPSCDPPVPGARLKAVQVIFRHGARTPLTQKHWLRAKWDVCGAARGLPELRVSDHATGDAMPECIDGKNLVHYEGGCTRGELTKLGQVQARELGDWLRQRYVSTLSFLPDTYSSAVVAARTTNYRRTRDTLHGVLGGLYPAASGPFTASAGQHHCDVILPQVNRCPHLATLLMAVRERVHSTMTSDPKVLAAEKRVRAHLQSSADSPPASDDAHINWAELHDALTALRAHDKPVYEHLTAEDLDDINTQATMKLAMIMAKDPSVLKLGTGPLIHDICEALTAAAKSSSGREPKLRLWSGHDTTIMPVMAALGTDLGRWPPYCSHIVLELWEAEGGGSRKESAEARHYVRVLFNKQEVAVPQGKPGAALQLDVLLKDMLQPLAVSPVDFELLCAAGAAADDRPQAKGLDISSVA